MSPVLEKTLAGRIDGLQPGRSRSMTGTLLSLSFSLLLAAGVQGESFQEPGLPAVPYSVPEKPWPEGLGLHRAVVRAGRKADALFVSLPWRRRDDPSKKRILVTDSRGKKIPNVFRVAADRWKAELVFGPLPGAGEYFVYYMPFTVQPGFGGYHRNYLPPEPNPDPEWVSRNKLERGEDLSKRPDLERGELLAFQARTGFDSFYPMEIPASPREVEALLEKVPGEPFLLFPEGRRFPIRMTRHLPLRWLSLGRGTFRGKACRNEYYAFQVGLFAARRAVRNVRVRFGDLLCGKEVIPATNFTCFNLGGIGVSGRPFRKRVDVPEGRVQALWFGLDVPKETRPGLYRGEILVGGENVPSKPVRLEILVEDRVLEDRGDGETWRHSRLRWLNSTLGISEDPIPPFPPLERRGRTISCLGRRVHIGAGGLPEGIESFGGEVLASPLRFVLETREGPAGLDYGPLRFLPSGKENRREEGEAGGITRWEVRGKGHGFTLVCRGEMEFDGHLSFRITLLPSKDLEWKDARLEIPFRPESARYAMGMGLPGGFTPVRHDWKWQGPHDSFWIGGPRAGLHCELRGSSYHGPLLVRFRPPPPPSWDNRGRGGFRIRRKGDAVTATVYTGPRKVRAGRPLEFEFALIVTPVKPLDTRAQFRDRYFHGIHPAEADIRAGVRVINVHHGTPLNPFINYPFVPAALERLRAYIEKWHRRGVKVKIYYTLRELTNHVTEIWALRSLGGEIFARGRGGGYPWLREHLVENYLPRWYHHFEDGTVCASLGLTGESRWYNYYVESIAWLLKNVEIDGLYLDDVSYDRRILKRIRRVMARLRPGCLIDLHSNTAFSKGPAVQYTEFFPYLDKLWFGEGFHYDRMSPDQWLVRCSGIPFGLMGDMLRGGGNRWLGMVFGMTARSPWTGGADNRAIWKVWDEFGIGEARMVGWWEKDCPVRAENGDVKATAYIRKGGRVLLALGNWSRKEVKTRLLLDWKALGLERAGAVLYAPAIHSFQPEAVFDPDDPIPLPAHKGRLLYVKRAP